MPVLLSRFSFSRRMVVAGGLAATLLRGGPIAAQRPVPERAQDAEDAALPSGLPLLELFPFPEGDPGLSPEDRLQVLNIAAALAPHGLEPVAAGNGAPDADAIEALHDAFADGPVSYWAHHEMWNAPESWQDTFGFDPYSVHALVDYGPAEDYCLLIQADVDADQVQNAWSALGYVPVTGAPEVMHLDVDDATRTNFLLDRPLGLFSGSYDYAAMLPGGIIALSSSQERVEHITALAGGGTGSILEHRAIAACAGLLPRETTLAWQINGARFWADPVDPPLVLPPAGTNVTQEQHDQITAELDTDEELLRQIEAEHGPMPALELITLAATSTQHLLMLCPLDPAAAGTALEIVSRRFEHMTSRSTTKPYTELFRIAETTVSENGVGVITLEVLAKATLFGLLGAGDLRFLNFA